MLNVFAPGKVHDPLGPDGEARVLGAGPLSFELVEPFRHWRMRLDGVAVETTVADQIAGHRPAADPSVPVAIDVDLLSAVPPWENGALLPEAKRVLDEQNEGALMGGPRFEQLALETASGTTRIAAESVLSTFTVMGGVGSNPAYPILQQAIVRYSWGGETANGMMERSMPADRIARS